MREIIFHYFFLSRLCHKKISSSFKSQMHCSSKITFFHWFTVIQKVQKITKQFSAKKFEHFKFLVHHEISDTFIKRGPVGPVDFNKKKNQNKTVQQGVGALQYGMNSLQGVLSNHKKKHNIIITEYQCQLISKGIICQ